MSKKQVRVAGDDIARFATCKPAAAIEEFIWNGLDAGGNKVDVRIEKTGVEPLQQLTAIEIEDCGEGMPVEEIKSDFGSTGGSRKIRKKTNSNGRVLHGRFGRGRFKFLVLAREARWKTTYLKDGKLWTYDAWINSSDPNYYDHSQPVAVTSGRCGTVVRLEGVKDEARSLLSEGTLQHLRQQLAFYLTNYPGVQVTLDGEVLDIEAAIERKRQYVLDVSEHTSHRTTLTVVEWSKATKVDSEQLLLCDDRGFVLSDIPTQLPTKDINCTAFIGSTQFSEWSSSGHLVAGEMYKGVAGIVNAARTKLAAHIRRRKSQKAKSLVKQWKAEQVYPYKSKPTQPADRAEQEVFNILASNIHQFHKPFRSATKESKRLTLELVKQSLESSPTALRRILSEVLKLPEQRQHELAQLLEYTNLEGIIAASRLVQERMDTILGFERLLFGKDWRSKLLERTQLHRLLVHELWLFGEEFQLDTDDETLRDVLKAHIKHMGREELAPDVDIATISGIAEIPDLMLTRRFRRGKDLFQHLVVELKRPTVPAGEDEVTQIERVARNVMKAEQFSKDSEKVKWTFMLVVNDLGEYGKFRLKTTTFPHGCIAKDSALEIYLLEWNEILQSAKLRYEFFREKLNLEASGDRGLEMLKTNYSHLLQGKGMSKAGEIKSGKLGKRKTG